MAQDAFLPDTVLTPEGGPRIVLIQSAGSGIAVLRLDVPLEEGPSESGAGALLRELALERMKGTAGPVGARLSAERTWWGISYSVAGAATDLDFLAYLLRQAAAEPTRDPAVVERARQRLWQRVAGEAETPSGRLINALRRKAAPMLPPLHGSPGSLAQMDAAKLHEVWWRSHLPAAMTVVVSADIEPEVLLASVGNLGAVESPGGPTLDAPAPVEPTTQHPAPLRTWYGEAFDGGATSDPHAEVASRLLADEITTSVSGFEAGVQLLELQGRWLIVLTGSAGRGESRLMRETIAGTLERTRSRLTVESARTAVERSRRDLLVRARTPWGLVEAISRHMAGREGSPRAALEYLEALGRVDDASLRDFIDRLQAAGPMSAEVGP